MRTPYNPSYQHDVHALHDLQNETAPLTGIPSTSKSSCAASTCCHEEPTHERTRRTHGALWFCVCHPSRQPSRKERKLVILGIIASAMLLYSVVFLAHRHSDDSYYNYHRPDDSQQDELSGGIIRIPKLLRLGSSENFDYQKYYKQPPNNNNDKNQNDSDNNQSDINDQHGNNQGSQQDSQNDQNGNNQGSQNESPRGNNQNDNQGGSNQNDNQQGNNQNGDQNDNQRGNQNDVQGNNVNDNQRGSNQNDNQRGNNQNDNQRGNNQNDQGGNYQQRGNYQDDDSDSYRRAKKARDMNNGNNSPHMYDHSNNKINVFVDCDSLAHKTPTPTTTPMPAGVNLGSWLSLEDYFYVGATGAVEVATPDANQAAVCLPPLHTGQASAPPWQSETDLLSSLITKVGVPQALKIVHAHRTSFVTEHDLQQLAQWGIKHVRVPLSWCFTNAHPNDIVDLHNTTHAYTKQLLHDYTCADPFYADQQVVWPAIPRTLVEHFLQLCAKHGITASLDLHTYPGATSPGTFSGMWPRPPRFWQHDLVKHHHHHDHVDVGRQLYRDFIDWMESLADTNPEAFAGLYGISPMNEPAHLAGIFRTIPDRDYLPPLSRDQADNYLQQLNAKQTNANQHDDDDDKDDDEYAQIPDGPHLRVMLWLDDAIDVFRNSKLPTLGKQLHVNVHESFLSSQVLTNPHDGDDEGGRHPSATKLIASWWSRVTTAPERAAWAVLDMHHYHAWEPACMGTSDGPPLGNYTCNDINARTNALERCTGWATVFRKAVDQYCGKGALLMSGEFSTSTHHRVRHACNDIDTLEASYLAQIKAATKANIKLYYWSYKMPFGGAFKSAWSFSQLMYLLGVSNRPDESNYNCGEHVPHAMEVTDDLFGGE